MCISFLIYLFEKVKHKDYILEEKKIFTRELFKTILLVSLMVVFVRFFVIQPFVVLGSSMEPTFHNNEYIFVEEISSRIIGIKRGDIVIFKHPENSCSAFVNSNFFNRTFLQGPCTNFIKRIIGLPGETVIIKDGAVSIKNNESAGGFTLDEKYIPKDENYKLKGEITRTLGKDEFFTLGDNRQPNASLDSREWGALPKNHIIGKAWLRLLPADKFGLVKHYNYK